MKNIWGIRFVLINIVVLILLGPFVIFYGPFESLRLFTVGAIVTSRHPQIAEIFLSEEQIDAFSQSYRQKAMTVEPVIMNKQSIIIDATQGIRIEEINGKYFHGKVMLVADPLQLQAVATREIGTAGQRLSELVEQNGAIAGINAGGFYDPNAQGNGAFPDGITIVDNRLIHNRVGNDSVNMIGFDHLGKLIIGKMGVKDLTAQKVENAVSFYPNLIVEGKPQIYGDGGWGLAPRTGIGQTRDGTVILVVIDGRQPGWSMGATLRDLMNVFFEYGAENAANLDGGSSTEMIYQGKIMNKLWNIYGERYIPTAFVVLPKEHRD